MKITADLRCAIRAISSEQRGQSWDEKRAANARAIAEFIERNPKAGKIIKKAKATYDKANAIAGVASRVIQGFGINVRMQDIDNRETFLRKGGRLPKEYKWTFNQVMVELVCAKPEQRSAILKKYGINWSEK